MRGAMERLKFEVSSLRLVSFEAPKAAAPNEANSPQTQGYEGEAADWKDELSMMNDAAHAGREVERPKPWFGRRSGVRPQCQSLAANRQSLTQGHVRLTTYCLRLFLVRGRAVRYDPQFDIMRCMMRHRIWRLCAVIGGVLAAPSVARADFSVIEFPQFAVDNALNWLFQILSTILLALSQIFGASLGLGGTTG